jgi:O-antigen ligase
MPPQIALGAAVAFVLWLFARDRALQGRFPSSLWIPLLWLGVIGSRPVSAWFGFEAAAAESEGSPFDRFVYLALMAAAFIVLQRRRINWGTIVALNKWLCVFLVYLGISTLWADYPFVSFKRWIKDIGNILMVLVVLSERDPVGAVKSILFRFGSVVIPASILLIRYYPDLGRYFNPFIWTYAYGGVTTDKNTLGMSLFIAGIGIFWRTIDVWRARSEHRSEVFAHLILIGMCLWLWKSAGCATSLVCAALAAGILLSMRSTSVRNFVQRVGLWGVPLLAVAIIVASLLFDPLEVILGGLGRDVTLTGRTDIWRQVLRVDINPFIGVGYSSFWQSERAASVSDALGFYFLLKEAHNGYLEVYLNSGLTGLGLLAGVLVTGTRRILRKLEAGGSYAAFCFAAFTGSLLYNMTESAFCGLVILWVVVLLTAMECPCYSDAAVPREAQGLKTEVEARSAAMAYAEAAEGGSGASSESI